MPPSLERDALTAGPQIAHSNGAQRDTRESDDDAQSVVPKRSRMRIGIFTESYPPVVNGVTTSVLTLIEQLEKMGHAVFVFAPRFPGHTGDPENVFRFPSVLTPFDRGYPLPIPFSLPVIASVARHNLDVIHSQVPFLLGLTAMMVARAEGKPLVATNHTLYTEYSHYMPVVPEEITKGVTRSMVRWYYERCDAVIAPSQMAAERLENGYKIKRTQIKVVPTGIPLPRAIAPEEIAATRARYGVDNGGKLLLYAGRIAKEKNLGLLLDTFEQEVAQAHPDTKLILAGSGVDAASIQERIEASPRLRSRAIMTGFINRADLDPLYAAADLFAFPSLTETQGVVLGEALAAGTPCCAVNAAGSPETVTSEVDGLLTQNDQRTFGAAINRLLADDLLRARMGEAARHLAEQRTPEQMARSIIQVYRAAQRRNKMRHESHPLGAVATAPAELLRKKLN